MKKLVAWVLTLICVLGLAGCGEDKTVNIDFPFEVEDVENVEMYHFVGTPGFVEKKVVISEADIKTLYEMFEGLELEVKEAKETAGVETTSFRLNLSDGTSYDLIYGGYGVKNGSLKSTAGGFEYFTSAAVGWYWEFLDQELEAVSVDKSELP